MLTVSSLALTCVLLLYTQPAAAICGGSMPIALCCMGVAPWSTNSYVWGGICGYTPSTPSEIIGGRCIVESSGSCPSGSIGTCCAGTWPGPSGECALGTNCGGSPSASPSTVMSTTTSTSPTPTPPPPLPSGWTVKSACAQDGASRILSNDVGTTLSNNTPNNCIAYCTAKGYDFAGVEYGSECHCGTGTANDPSPLDPSSCGNPCAGDAGQTCGGSWAIQIYQNPAVPETLPDGWALVRYCAVDEANRVIIDDQVTILPNNTPATCVEYCDAAEFDYAGVEYGDECHCGTGYTGGARAPTTDCNMPCSGNPSLTCGAGWRIQIYSSEPQTSS